MNKLLPILCLALVAPALCIAEDNFEAAVKKIEARFEPAAAGPGATVMLHVRIDLNEGWLTYPTVQVNPQIAATKNRITLPVLADIIFVDGIKDPGSRTEVLGTLGEKRYYRDTVTWQIPAIIRPEAKPGERTAEVKVRVLVCVKRKNDKGEDYEICLPPKNLTLMANLNVLDVPPVAIEQKYREAYDKALAPPVEEKKTPEKKDPSPDTGPLQGARRDAAFLIPGDSNYAADMAAVEGMLPKFKPDNEGFVTFVLTAMFWGMVTLLTPCVFPMIPITVSFFLKQGEKKQHNPLTMAAVYTLTIVVVLGTAALFFLSFFSRLAVNPWMNAALGTLFVVFAMSLFGMFEIVLPSFMVRFTSARQRQGGYGGVIFMALSFSIVSFTCVAPFLGGFAGLVSSGNFSNLQLAAGALAFSGTFAAPFFLLAIFPSLLKKIPKSGSWMNTIKVVMGFLELAAALKFFRTAELRLISPPVVFTYDFVLSMYIVILLFTALYLLNLYRLPHDEPQDHIGVTRMLVGLLCIGISVYLIPGLFSSGGGQGRQRPGGTLFAWVDAFLLPEPSSAEVIGGEVWSGDLRRSIEDARATGDTVFIDFTGVTCTNCKLNEKEVFPQPAVAALMRQFRLVQIYTDEIPTKFYESPPPLEQREEDAMVVNRRFQKNVFGTEQLPLYVLLRPKPGIKGGPVEIIGKVYKEGKINDVSAFEAFLRTGLTR